MTDEDAWAAMDLWRQGDLLVRRSRLVVDRPRGSAHPRFPEFVYPLDYGYLDGTVGGDGEGVDLWIGDDPSDRVTAVACTIDPFKRNAEVKLLWRCTPEQIRQVECFYADQPQAALITRRPAAD